MGRRQPPEDKRLNEAALIAATGISQRKLIRWRQDGLIPMIRPRGLGRGSGSTAIEYPLTAIATTNRLIELSQTFKSIDKRRWHLWLEGYPVRIARDLADTLGALKAIRSKIKTLNDIETKIPERLKPRNLPRGYPLRMVIWSPYSVGSGCSAGV